MNNTVNPYKTASKAWGLYRKDNNKAIPLKSLHISVQIVHNTARVFYTQDYYNDFHASLETEFFFPISPDACFDSFQAKFSDTTITGLVKQKQQAQEEYKQAISSGKTAAYSEINPDTGDIMKVLIGNIPPMSPISITYSYVEKLTVTLNKFWCFRLFSSITPRYNGNLNDLLKTDVALLAAYPTISDKSSSAYPWHIDVQIQSPSAISTVKSPSHRIVSKYGNENHTCRVTLDDASSDGHTPSKDFVLLFASDNGKNDHIESVLTPFEDGYCAMISIMADFDQAGPEEAYDNFVKAKEVKEQHAMTDIRGEYIFLIDRSGSMSGSRIDMAKTSLTLFLKSLPRDSLFNIVSFGSEFTFLHSESVQTSKQSIETSCGQIQCFTADMGGTEIYECLKRTFDQPLKTGYPRFVFLLTDGDVSNTTQVLQLIQSNSHKAQVFSIGIGSGCSAELITKAAHYGKGKHEFVVDNKEIYEKVISLLHSSLSPCLSDISFHADNFDAFVKSVSPNPATVPHLLNGQTATYFLFLRKEAFNETTHNMIVRIRMYDSKVRSYRTVEASLNNGDVIENKMIAKLGIHSMIQCLESRRSEAVSDVLWMQEEEIKEALLELSLKYGILCKDTAFICEVRLKDNISIQNAERIKSIVPAIEASNFYEDVDVGLGGGVFSDDDGWGCDVYDCCDDVVAFPTKAASYMREEEEADVGLGGGLFGDDDWGDDDVVVPPKNEKSKQSQGKKSSNNASYLDVVMKQDFDGFWDPSDKQLLAIILKASTLTPLPAEIKSTSNASNEAIWMTILVLIWLEIVCQSDKKAWLLIHQKGCEWLKEQGVNYESVKNVGIPYIKT